MDFVELHRLFIPLSKDQEPNLELSRFWGSRYPGALDWKALRRRRRVVLLAEASSGKSEEFRHQHELLAKEGKAAFFLRIEELAEQGFEAALDAESAARFERWRNGTDDGWFFLDSIDEARLNRKNFESALKRFARETDTALGRAHVLVSCRVTDWKGAEDRAAVTRWLPAPAKPKQNVVTTPADNSALLDPIFGEKKKDEKKSEEENLPELLVVQLAPLTEEQYRALATAAGVEDIDAFVAAIGQQGLDAFTERPGDLLDLASFWKSNGKFGRFVEMVEHGVKRKLAETDPFRADNTVISIEKVRAGAERAAAALTLGKSFTLRAPGHDPDPSLAAGALDAALILPEWNDAERGALLRRGLFAPSTYGRVRFHHRSTQEYLTAKWLDGLMQAGCPHSEVHGLLFAERYGVKAVVPSLRPSAAWLALWHPDILEEIIRREPLLLIQHGDPSSLSMDVRKRMLATYAAKQAAGDISDDSLEPRALWMFGHEDLADSILAAWKANPRQEFRFDLLRFIREGAIKGAAKLAAKTVLDVKADDRHRLVALHASAACNDDKTMRAAAAALRAAPQKVSANLARLSCEVLYPKYLTTAELLNIISHAQPPKRHTVDGFGYSIDTLYKAAGDAPTRAALLQGVASLCLAPPFAADYERISQRHKQLAEHLHEIASVELTLLGSGKPPPYLVPILMTAERADPRSFQDGDKPALHQLVAANSHVNRQLFWADVAEQRAHGSHGLETPTRHWQVFLSGGHRSLWNLQERDLPWLYDDLAERTAEEDRRLVLSAIAEILKRAGNLQTEETNLRAAIGTSTTLNADLSEYISPPPEPRAFAEDRRRREERDREREEQETTNKASWVQFCETLKAQPGLLSNPANLKSWRAGIHRLHTLTRWLRDRTGAQSEDAVREWRLLEEGFDRQVAEAYRDGMKALWRVVKPERPKRTPGNAVTIKWQTILGYAAVGLEAAEDSDWAIRLTDGEAKIAARHGCYADQGYPDWLDNLLSAFPKIVLPILRKEVATQWRATSQGRSDFLWRFGTPAQPVQHPVAVMLLSVIQGSEAGVLTTLDRGLRVIRNLQLDANAKTILLRTARSRLKAHVKAGRTDFALRYLAMVLLLEPDSGVTEIGRWLRSGPKATRAAHAEMTLGVLFERHDPLAPAALNKASVRSLENLLHMAYEYIRPEDDAVHEGSYSPDDRDHAENARNVILTQLLNRPGADAYRAMQRASEHATFALRAHRFRELARGKAERDADGPAWSEAEALAFERDHTAPVKTGADLLRVITGALRDIAFNLMKGDVTSRPLLERAKNEDEVQNWLVEQLNAHAKGRFHALREAQVAEGDKPDVIAASTSAVCQVAIEVKHGGMGWTVRDLDTALSVQLAQDYLKPDNRRHGVLVVTHHRDRRWLDPSTKAPMHFDDLVGRLSANAKKIVENDNGAIEVDCVGINAFKEPTKPAAVTRTGGPARSRAGPRASQKAAKPKARVHAKRAR